MTLRRLLSALTLLGTLAVPGVAHAADLIIDGSLTTNLCPGGTVVSLGRACEYGGEQTFDKIELKNGAVLFVKPYVGGDKVATGNLTLKATTSITIDKSSRVQAKGRGYQRALCSNGPGPAAFPLSGGRGGCAVSDSGGGAAHVGPGGRGTKDIGGTPVFPRDYEEAGPGTFNGTACTDLSNIRTNDGLPTVAGLPFYHHILTPEFGPAGGDKGCRDNNGYAANASRGGNGGGRIVLFAGNAGQTGLLHIEGRVSADGDRGCSEGNDSAGGGAGGTILLVGDKVEVASTARISAHGGRGGDSQPKCLPCQANSDCQSGQTCQTVVDPASGASAGRCGPCNCTPCSSNAQCRADLGQTCKNLGGDLGNVCADASNQCTPFDPADNEAECVATQNNGTCDDCGGAGGGGLINVLSRIASLHPEAIFDVRGALGGVCPVCSGEAGGGEGELQIDGAYVGEICDGFDNDFNGVVDDGLPPLTCAGGVQIPSCVNGKPQECPADVPACKTAVTDTRPRFAVVVDTSGSMLLDLKGNPTFGDGSEGHLGIDTNADSGVSNGNDSRLFIAKRALGNVFAAFPESDYALARYYQDASQNRSCQTANWFECASNCCSYDDPTNNVAPAYPARYPGNTCNLPAIYPTAGFTGLPTNVSIGWPAGDNTDCINYAGTCGPPERGAQFVTDFNSPLQNHLMWLDNHERGFDPGMKSGQHCSWAPDNLTDCELRATGPTPLAGSLAAAQAFLAPIVQCDGAVPCRKYATILLTDGAESCQGNPVAAATALRSAVPGVEIKTYVIGFAVGATEVAGLDAIANAGGTTKAFVASNEAELANALAAIIAGSTVFETCNGADDDCDGLVDEDFPEKGKACDDGNKGVCKGTGAFACTADGKGTACVITTPGQASSDEICDGVDNNCNGIIDEGDVCKFCVPQLEICDGKDNDCDGQIDESPVDVGKPCGLDIGICKPGLTACTAGKLTCEGGVAPKPEVCNGIDDNCDNVIDGLTATCYSGPPGTENVGVCRPGTQICTAVAGSGVPAFGACVGEVFPTDEVCDGLDNDCDGTVDDAIKDGLGHTTGDTCCPFGDKCGVGVCKAGTYQCAGSAVLCGGGTGPSVETCDGLDNDCNGKVDDIPGLGSACKLPGGCAGTLACDPLAKQVVCVSGTAQATETCNGLDDNCNGQIDEEPAVSQNDKNVGVDCDVPAAPNDKGACKPGKTICKGGVVTCAGSVKPLDEVCDGVDSDCDGVADNDAPCPSGSKCAQGTCAVACAGGEFSCPGGYTCISGACLPVSCEGVVCGTGLVCEGGRCVAGTGGSGQGGSAGASGKAGSSAGGKAGAAGAAGGTTAGNAGASGTAGTGGSGAAGKGEGGNAGQSGSGAGTGTSGGAGKSGASNPADDRVSLATGGGGFACSAPASAPPRGAAGALLAALGLVTALGRRARLARVVGQKGGRLPCALFRSLRRAQGSSRSVSRLFPLSSASRPVTPRAIAGRAATTTPRRSRAARAARPARPRRRAARLARSVSGATPAPSVSRATEAARAAKRARREQPATTRRPIRTTAARAATSARFLARSRSASRVLACSTRAPRAGPISTRRSKMAANTPAFLRAPRSATARTTTATGKPTRASISKTIPTTAASAG